MIQRKNAKAQKLKIVCLIFAFLRFCVFALNYALQHEPDPSDRFKSERSLFFELR